MNRSISSYFFFVLLLGAAIAAVIIFRPFLTVLVLAVAGAVLAFPLYRRLAFMFGGGEFARTLAAFITVVAALFVVLVPAFFLFGGVYAEIQTLYASMTDEGNRSHIVSVLNSFSQSVSLLVFGVLPQYSFDSFNITEYIKNILEMIFSNLDTVFASMTQIGAYTVVFLLALFYFLRDGVALANRFISWSPVLEDNGDYIIHSLKRAIQSVFAGTLSVCLIDGISVGFSFFVFGIPAPALWGTVAAIAALVPGIGVMLVVIPGVAYLLLAGQYWFAAGLVIWSYAMVLIADHIVGPALVNRGVKIHPFLILLSVLGGILSFGIVGFLMGPLILVFLFALLEIYRTSFKRPDGDLL